MNAQLEKVSRMKTFDIEDPKNHLTGNDPRNSRKWMHALESKLNAKGYSRVIRGPGGMREISTQSMENDNHLVTNIDHWREYERNVEGSRNRVTHPIQATSVITSEAIAAYHGARKRLAEDEKELDKINVLSTQYIEETKKYCGSAPRAVIEEIVRNQEFQTMRDKANEINRIFKEMYITYTEVAKQQMETDFDRVGLAYNFEDLVAVCEQYEQLNGEMRTFTNLPQYTDDKLKSAIIRRIPTEMTQNRYEFDEVRSFHNKNPLATFTELVAAVRKMAATTIVSLHTTAEKRTHSTMSSSSYGEETALMVDRSSRENDNNPEDKRHCYRFFSVQGCTRGDQCRFSHNERDYASRPLSFSSSSSSSSIPQRSKLFDNKRERSSSPVRRGYLSDDQSPAKKRRVDESPAKRKRSFSEDSMSSKENSPATKFAKQYLESKSKNKKVGFQLPKKPTTPAKRERDE